MQEITCFTLFKPTKKNMYNLMTNNNVYNDSNNNNNDTYDDEII